MELLKTEKRTKVIGKKKARKLEKNRRIAEVLDKIMMKF
jgi:hypothetical protein|tara:strand:- start:843 stop:959 length:117 start_codon:yes stop_codon:yes gene_type:complete